MATQAQLRHAASIARHFREQALEPALRECQALENFYEHEQPSQYASYPIERLVNRIQKEIYQGTVNEMGTILDDMLGGLTNE